MSKITKEDIKDMLVLDNLNGSQRQFLKILAGMPKIKAFHNDMPTEEDIRLAKIFQEISDEIDNPILNEETYNDIVFDFVSDFVSETADDIEFWAEETEYDMTKLYEYRIDKEALLKYASDILKEYDNLDFDAETFVDMFLKLDMNANETAKTFYKKYLTTLEEVKEK